MTGKPLGFTILSFKARHSLALVGQAEPHLQLKGETAGKPEAFRTECGRAAKRQSENQKSKIKNLKSKI
jgi:hypothetical protein